MENKELNVILGEEPLKIEVKRLRSVQLPEVFDIGDWIDLRAAEDIYLKSDEFKLIPLGIAMRLPQGYEAHVVPRSSTYKKYRVIQANSQGIIDNSYAGDKDEWFFPAYATDDTYIKKNERICQFRIVPVMPKVEIVEVDKLNDENRGGFGAGTDHLG